MKRLLLLLIILGLTIVPFVYAAEPETIGYVERARIVMDLLRDNEVTESDNYAEDKVDFISGPHAIIYADAFCAYYGQYEDGTNNQKAGFFLFKLKQHCKSIRKHVALRDRAAEDNTELNATIDTELGKDEAP